MADNTTLNTGTGGDVIASDDITGVKYQRVKITLGADGVNDGDVSSSNALPVSLPSIPSGTNNIGDVDVLTLPSIPAGNNNIGDVDIASIAAGDNNIGNVDVVTLPSIPAGTNNIGDVDVLTLPNVKFLPGLQDVFGTLTSAPRTNQVDIQFYKDTPQQLVTVTTNNSGTATSSVGGALFTSSTNTNGGSKGVSFVPVMYMGAGETYALFSCTFTAGISSSYQRIGIYDTNNGAFIGYEGTTFNITTRNNGSDVSVAKASWNVDTLTGAAGSKFTSGGTPVAITLTNLNVYRIRFGWIGGAPIYFEVLSPDGDWVTFHVVRFPNSSTAPSFRNADLPVTLDIQKTAAAATDLQMLTSCWVGGTVSERDDLAVIAQGSQTAIGNNILLENAGTGPIDVQNYSSIALQINVAAGTVTAGAVIFEGTNDITGGSWVPILLFDSNAPNTAPVSTYTIVASTNRFFEGALKYKYIRARLSTGITGTTTGVQAYYRISTSQYIPQGLIPVQIGNGTLSAGVIDETGASAVDALAVGGGTAHDAVDSGNPIKMGLRAISHGSNPTAVASADRTHWYSNIAGIPFVIGGHPNIQTAEYYTTGAQTDDNIMPAIAAGTIYVVTMIQVTASNANTVNTAVRIGFGATAVPTQGASGADAVTQVVLSHGGIPPGSGMIIGNGGGIIGIGGDGVELRITNTAPTTGDLRVVVTYYTIAS
jgi:hypothetical protein